LIETSATSGSKSKHVCPMLEKGYLSRGGGVSLFGLRRNYVHRTKLNGSLSKNSSMRIYGLRHIYIYIYIET